MARGWWNAILNVVFPSNKVYDDLDDCLDLATQQGFPEKDYTIAKDYLSHGEPDLAFEHLCGQLYEYDVSITKELYDLMKSAGEKLKMPSREWEILQRLIK